MRAGAGGEARTRGGPLTELGARRIRAQAVGVPQPAGEKNLRVSYVEAATHRRFFHFRKPQGRLAHLGWQGKV